MSDACISERSEMPFLMNKSNNLLNVEKLIDATLPIIKGRTRFFVVKSFDYDSI
jgi:hypothetical protein